MQILKVLNDPSDLFERDDIKFKLGKNLLNLPVPAAGKKNRWRIPVIEQKKGNKRKFQDENIDDLSKHWAAHYRSLVEGINQIFIRLVILKF